MQKKVFKFREVECSKCGHKWEQEQDEQHNGKYKCPTCNEDKGEPRIHESAPNWLFQHIQKSRAAFGLSDFETVLKMVPELELDGRECRATTECDYNYMTAIIRINPDEVKCNSAGRSTATHEVAHVLLSEYDRCLEDFIAMLSLNEKQARGVRELFVTPRERTCERIGRYLSPMLELLDEVPDYGPNWARRQALADEADEHSLDTHTKTKSVSVNERA